MNRISISILLASMLVLAGVSSCEKPEPSTWTESVHRVATVRSENGYARLAIDYSGESFQIKNFKTASDMAAFGVQDGDRVIASMTFSAVGTAANSTFTLDSVHHLEVLKFEPSRPSDTLNYYYEMDVVELGSLRYPSSWCTGHLVNVAPVFFAPKGEILADFSVYPEGVSNDTLFIRMYSNIPDEDISYNPQFRQKIVNIDVSSLMDSVPDQFENMRRSSMLNSLRALQNSHIYVTVMTPNTLRAKNSKNPAGGYKYEQDVPTLPTTVRMPFDF